MSNIALALTGGALIGLSASLYWLSHGRIAGISGLLGGLVARHASDRGQRGAFLAGLLIAGVALYLIRPGVFGPTNAQPLWLVAIAGVLVGYGTRLGSGCTSGHGVCGLGRLAPRSFVAVLAFMATGIFAASLLRHWLGVPA